MLISSREGIRSPLLGCSRRNVRRSGKLCSSVNISESKVHEQNQQCPLESDAGKQCPLPTLNPVESRGQDVTLQFGLGGTSTTGRLSVNCCLDWSTPHRRAGNTQHAKRAEGPLQWLGQFMASPCKCHEVALWNRSLEHGFCSIFFIYLHRCFVIFGLLSDPAHVC